MDYAQLERDAERIFVQYNRKELFPEFLSVFGEEIEQDNPICNAVAQRDFEAIGGLLYKAFEEYLSECAEYEAQRIQGWA